MSTKFSAAHKLYALEKSPDAASNGQFFDKTKYGSTDFDQPPFQL